MPTSAACALLTSMVLLAGCASEGTGPTTPRDGREPSPAPPPDAGTATGHGGDVRRVAVPHEDGSPPTVTIRLATPRSARTLAEASQPPGRVHGSSVDLAKARLLGTTVGEDPNGGVARVRVSISERITCRDADARQFERPRRRYFPPPQIERVRAAPGALLPTRRRRSLQMSLIGARCGPHADAVEVRGQLWGEAINGHGLEAVTPHIHFSYRPPGLDSSTG